MKSQAAAECDRFSGNWWKAKFRNLGISILAALILAMVIRTTVAESFVAASDAVAPEIRKSSRTLVYKLAGEYSAGDIIVYRRDNEKALLGRVAVFGKQAAELTVERNNEPPETIPLNSVVGRVILSSR
jgi:signal peptidase I